MNLMRVRFLHRCEHGRGAAAAGKRNAMIRAVSTVHEWLSLLSDTLKSLLNLTSVLQSEGAASATATHSQIQNPVWNVNIGNGCSLNSKMLLQIQQTFECV